jgi:cellulose biosynthesis protein BcsQ
MKFLRSKKLVFFNNKWGVGKTTLAFNIAVKFAEKWYKTVIMDLDPQCNISRLALWENFENSLFSSNENNIYWVLKWIFTWMSDINLNIPFLSIRENLSILPWSLKLSQYQDLLITAYNQATAWIEIWYTQTSAISRFLFEKWLNDEIDIFIIDVSPSLDLLNRIILLWADYFITPLNPDAFSLQWIENLWTTLASWKENWKNSARVMSQTKNIPVGRVLSWEWLFIWYVINSYNQYGRKPIKSHTEWMEKIPSSIKKYLSENHSKNWLVQKSWESSLAEIKDYWQLPTDWQETWKAIFELEPWKDFKDVEWTRENLELSKVQFETLFERIVEILNRY